MSRLPEITQHQVALQQIASLNNDTREVFSTGYQESLDYVVSTLKAAGYNPQVNQFNFPVWNETKPPVLNMVSPTPKTYVPGDADDSDLPTADFITMANSPTVELTNAPVFPVGGIIDPPTGGSASGCAAADYAGVSGGRARPARHVRLRREVVARPGGRRDRRHHLQRGQHARAPEPDLRRQPARPAGDDRCSDHELHARQRPAAGLQAGQEPDRRLQGLRHVHRPLPAAGDRRDQGRRPEPRRRGRRAPRLGARRARHQRRRLRHGDAACPGPGARRRPLQPPQQDPLRMVGCGGGGPDRLDLLRAQPEPDRSGQDRRDARLRHAVVAELRPLRL